MVRFQTGPVAIQNGEIAASAPGRSSEVKILAMLYRLSFRPRSGNGTK